MSTALRTRAGVAELDAALAKRAAIYLRISDDKGGRGLGVERQREDTRAHIAREGYTLVGEFVDNDISAFSGKPRPGYLALVEEVRAGRVDVIVVYRYDRLYRRSRELDDLIDLVDGDRHVDIDATSAGAPLDLGTTNGRRLARITGAISQGESEDIRDKVQRAMIQNAELGKWHGPLRTFGYRGTRVGDGHEFVVVEDEARVIVDAVDRVLAGESLVNLAVEYAAAGVTGVKGSPMTHQALRKIILSARIAGWREHTPGRTAGGPSWFPGGEFVARGEWPAIVDRSKVERLRRKLGNPDRKHGPNARTYLLSGGLAVCGECGGNLTGRPDRGGRRYICPRRPNNPVTGCGRVSIDAELVEAYVRAEVRNAHKSGRFADALAAVEDDGTRAAYELVDSIREERAGFDKLAAAGKLTPTAYVTITEGVDARLAAAQRELDKLAERESTSLLAGGVREFDRAWREGEEAGNLDVLRARLSAALLGVTVNRAARPSNRIEPGRVELDWRH